ncbi:entericidin [Gemmobacter sp.]|nr:entericidin [Gemmobacter sp.]
MKRIIMGAALALALALAGCNTVDGVGRDISGGAQRVGTWF